MAIVLFENKENLGEAVPKEGQWVEQKLYFCASLHRNKIWHEALKILHKWYYYWPQWDLFENVPLGLNG